MAIKRGTLVRRLKIMIRLPAVMTPIKILNTLTNMLSNPNPGSEGVVRIEGSPENRLRKKDLLGEGYLNNGRQNGQAKENDRENDPTA